MPEDTPRSVSGELDPDSDIESHLDHADEQSVGGPNKPGRKKNPNSQAARRDQNRIAQREFRLRKQQRIRDLEARVELLSASQDEALTDCRAVLRDLMAENHALRGLLKSVSGFIGDGAGGMLSKLGWDMADFDSFVNKAETDTAWESFQARKQSHKTSQTSNAMSSMLGAQSNGKRPADDDSGPGPGPAKKARGMSSSEQNGDRRDSYPLMLPMSSTVPPASSLYPPPPPQGRSPQDNMFSDLMQPGNSPVFMPSTTSSTSSHYAVSAEFQPYVSQMNMNVEQRSGAMSYSTNKTNAAAPPPQRVLPQNSMPTEEPEDHDMAELRDPKKIEAMKLIKYHLDNFMRNSAYCLPASLRPTLVQRTINHESVIDRLIYPELRDRIILLRGQISLADCLFDYKKAIKLHGDDVLAQHNWELAEWWLRKYSYLIDKTTLNVCNRWRRERGEPDLSLSDIGAQGDSPAS